MFDKFFQMKYFLIPTIFKVVLLFIFIYNDTPYDGIPYNEIGRIWIWLELLFLPCLILFSIHIIIALFGIIVEKEDQIKKKNTAEVREPLLTKP